LLAAKQSTLIKQTLLLLKKKHSVKATPWQKTHKKDERLQWLQHRGVLPNWYFKKMKNSLL
jgi:hypothetical protein